MPIILSSDRGREDRLQLVTKLVFSQVISCPVPVRVVRPAGPGTHRRRDHRDVVGERRHRGSARGRGTRSSEDRPIRSSSTSAASKTACCDAAGPGELMAYLRAVRERGVGPQRRVHHRERVRGQRILAREDRQHDPVTGAQPAAAAQHRRDNDIGLGQHDDQASRVAPGDDHAAAAVSLSGSPGRQPSILMTARSPTRPETSIRPDPCTASSGREGISGTDGRGAAVPDPPYRPPGSRMGTRGNDRSDELHGHGHLRGRSAETARGGRRVLPRVRVMSVLRKISGLSVRGGRAPMSQCVLTGGFAIGSRS